MILLALLLAAAASAQTREVALTFDDLPSAGDVTPAEAEAINRAIVAELGKHRAPAVGFVNEKAGERIGTARWERILNGWLDAGLELGNHTFAHLDLNDLRPEEFERQVILGEAVFARLLAKRGAKPRYLRFPFNHIGGTEDSRKAAATFLASRGYEIAACTIDTSDYEFSRAYDAALAAKDAAAARIEREYLDYTAVQIAYYDKLNAQVLGRTAPHVMLLHANRLNAAVLARILEIFEARAFRFVALEKAQADPAYAIEVAANKFGPMWGYRLARTMRVKVNGAAEMEPSEWIRRYGRK